jgi:hypothetical protein
LRVERVEWCWYRLVAGEVEVELGRKTGIGWSVGFRLLLAGRVVVCLPMEGEADLALCAVMSPTTWLN